MGRSHRACGLCVGAHTRRRSTVFLGACNGTVAEGVDLIWRASLYLVHVYVWHGVVCLPATPGKRLSGVEGLLEGLCLGGSRSAKVSRSVAGSVVLSGPVFVNHGSNRLDAFVVKSRHVAHEVLSVLADVWS